jgi:hypothetical protein
MACAFHECVSIAEPLLGRLGPFPTGPRGPTDYWRDVMVIALAGIIGWLLVLTTALSLGAAAKRGDELIETARSVVADAEPDAKIIPFSRVRRTPGRTA